MPKTEKKETLTTLGHRETVDLALTDAKTQWLKEILQRQLPLILTLANNDEDRQKAQLWVETLQQKMNQRGLKTPKQQQPYLREVAKIITKINPQHCVLDVLKSGKKPSSLTKAQPYSLNAPKALPIEIDPIVQKAIALLDSSNWTEQIAGLTVITGLKLEELVKTALLKPKTSYSVEATVNGSPREIPTLVPSQQVVETWDRVRNTLPTTNLDVASIASCYADSVITACQPHFSSFIPVKQAKDTVYAQLYRAVYPAIATHWYCPNGANPLEYMAYITGKFTLMKDKPAEVQRKLATNLHSLDYAIADGNGEIDERRGIKLGIHPDIVVIEAFKDYNHDLSLNQIPELNPPSPSDNTNGGHNDAHNPEPQTTTSKGSDKVQSRKEANTVNKETTKPDIEEHTASTSSNSDTMPVRRRKKTKKASSTKASSNKANQTKQKSEPAIPIEDNKTLLPIKEAIAILSPPSRHLSEIIKDKVPSLLNNDSPHHKLAGLMATTGCLPSELLGHQFFELQEEGNWVLYSVSPDKKKRKLNPLVDGTLIIHSLAKLKQDESVNKLEGDLDAQLWPSVAQVLVESFPLVEDSSSKKDDRLSLVIQRISQLTSENIPESQGLSVALDWAIAALDVAEKVRVKDVDELKKLNFPS